MKNNNIVLPDLNQRIKLLIDKLANGNVAEFVRMTNISSHQVLNRIFKIDSRTNKYPSPSSNILNGIKIHLKQVNYEWLLTGEGKMMKEDKDNLNMTFEKANDELPISNLIKAINNLSEAAIINANAVMKSAEAAVINAEANNRYSKNMERLLDMLAGDRVYQTKDVGKSYMNISQIAAGAT